MLFVALAGVVAAGLAVGAVVLLRGGSSHHAADLPPARLAGNLFAAAPSATADGRDQELVGAAVSGSTVVAIGDEFDQIDTRAQFLVSADGGRSFKSAAVRTPDGGEPPFGDMPRQVAGGPGAWVALGTSSTSTGVTSAVVWTSRDGQAWTRQPDSGNPVFAPADRVDRIVATQSGFVAVGDTSAKGDYSDAAPVVWRSPDGRQWERLGESRLKMSTGTLSLVNAVANGNTIIVHGTGTQSGKKKPVDAVWRSGDGGQTWHQASVPQPAGSGGIAIAATPSGFFLARNVPGKNAVVLASPDGLRWSQAGKIQLPGYGGLLRITGSGGALAAVVTSGRQALLARSPNGSSWQAAGTIPLPSGRTITDVVVTAQSTILVGRETASDLNAVLVVRDAQGRPVPVDLSTIPGAVQPDKAVMGVAASNGALLAVGSANGRASAWTSPDGTRWNRVVLQGPASARTGGQRLLGATPGPKGWLAVGYDGTAPRRPLLFGSPGGTVWQPVGGGGAFKPNGGNSLATYATASGPAGYVVVGEDGFSAAVWRSPDLKTWQRGSGSTSDDLTGTPAGGRWMRAVTAASSGYVAVGGLNDPSVPSGPRNRPAAWTSPDGLNWTLHQLPLPGGATGGWLTEVAAKNNVVVAAGTATGIGSGAGPGGSEAFAFVSADGGRTWRPGGAGSPVLPAGAGTGAGAGALSAATTTVTAATATGDGFVIAGTVGPAGNARVVLWTSRDGAAWSPATPGGTGLSGPGDHELDGLTTLGGNLVAVGDAADHTGKEPTLWLRPAP